MMNILCYYSFECGGSVELQQYSYRGRKGLPVALASGRGPKGKVLRLALSIDQIVKSYAGKHDNRLFNNCYY